MTKGNGRGYTESDGRAEMLDTAACCDLCLDREVDGAVNFRDLGGYRAGAVRIRRGLLYRSGMTHTITPAGLQALVERYGLRTVIDLRAPSELAEDGVPAFDRFGIRYHHAPVFDNVTMTTEARAQRLAEMRAGTYDWTGIYVRMVDVGAAAYRQLFEVLARPDALPAVFHCAAGRDRTGVAAALLLAALGVEPEDIAADYALTGVHLRPHAGRFLRPSAPMRLTADEIARALDTSADAMAHFLALVTEQHGSVEGYLMSIGVAPETLMAIRDRLLE